MPVALSSIRDLLLPGLWEIQGINRTSDYWQRPIQAPHIWIPKLSIPEAVIVGAAAALIKNPEVTRRFWAGWRL